MIENIREQAYVVEKIAEGDMTVDVRVKSDKDLLGKKLKEMVEINNEVLQISMKLLHRWQQEQNRYPTQACSFRRSN